jgi:2-methylisocitrate lyase-like PEP mutase family enzyme
MIDQKTAVQRLAAWQSFVSQTEKAEAAALAGDHFEQVTMPSVAARLMIQHHEDVVRQLSEQTARAARYDRDRRALAGVVNSEGG